MSSQTRVTENVPAGWDFEDHVTQTSFYRWRHWESSSKILTQMFTNRHRPGLFWRLRWASSVEGYLVALDLEEVGKDFRHLPRPLEESKDFRHLARPFWGAENFFLITLLKWLPASAMGGAGSRQSNQPVGEAEGSREIVPWMQKVALPSQPCYLLAVWFWVTPWTVWTLISSWVAWG